MGFGIKGCYLWEEKIMKMYGRTGRERA